jgi:hypothetical protein
MTPFFALLSAYYLCDATASMRPLAPSAAQSCAAKYEAVRARFEPDGTDGPHARRLSYMRFKAWEAENADLVARLRAEARMRAREMLLPGEKA